MKKPIKKKIEAKKPVKISAQDKERRFIEEYPKDWNGTQAAIRSGILPSSAGVMANRWLKKSYIKAEIDKKRQELSKQSNLEAQDYWDNLKEILDFDPAELFDANGIALDMSKIPVAIRKSLKGYKVSSKITDGGKDAFAEVDFKYPDRLAAVKELGNALKITDPDGGAGAKRITAIVVNINAV